MPRHRQHHHANNNTELPELFWDLFTDVWLEIEERYTTEQDGTVSLSSVLNKHTQDKDYLASFARLTSALATLGLQIVNNDPAVGIQVSWSSDLVKANEIIDKDTVLDTRHRVSTLLSDLLFARSAQRKYCIPSVGCPKCDTCKAAAVILRAFAGVVSWYVMAHRDSIKYVFSKSGAKSQPNTVASESHTTSSNVGLRRLSASFWQFFCGIWEDMVEAYYDDECGGTDLFLYDNYKNDPDFLLNLAHVTMALGALKIKCERSPPSKRCKDDTLSVSWDITDFPEARKGVSHFLSELLEAQQEGSTHNAIELDCPNCDVCRQVLQLLHKFSEVVGWRVTENSVVGKTTFTF